MQERKKTARPLLNRAGEGKGGMFCLECAGRTKVGVVHGSSRLGKCADERVPFGRVPAQSKQRMKQDMRRYTQSGDVSIRVSRGANNNKQAAA